MFTQLSLNETLKIKINFKKTNQYYLFSSPFYEKYENLINTFYFQTIQENSLNFI